MSEADEKLLKYHRALEKGLVDSFANDHAYADLAQKGFATGAVVIVAPTKQDYQLPSHFRKTMGKTQLSELRELLGRLWRHREMFVGMSLHETTTLYNGDPETLVLQDDFAIWGEVYLRQRLRRPSPKDCGDPIRTWARIVGEFVDWFGHLSQAPASGHSVVLAGAMKHLCWVLYQHTLAQRVHWGADGDMHIDFNHQFEYAFITKYLNFNQHHLVDSFGALAVALEVLAIDVDAMPAKPLVELGHIASDLMEFRGRLLRDYNPVNSIASLPNGMFVGWSWGVGHRAGVLYVGSSVERVLGQIENREDGVAVHIGLDGQIMCASAPYQRYAEKHVIRWTLGVLRPLHAQMFAEWDRLGPLAVVEDAAGELAELEAIAAACEVLVEEDVVERQVDETLGRVRVPPVRTTQLLNTLEQHFDCQIRRGKGSEITVFRPGGHIYTLPAHKRNTHYPSWMIRLLLKRVGIAPIDFATKICKRVQRY